MEQNKIVIYKTNDGQTSIDVKLENETVWLSQQQMALLFGVEENNITYHIQRIIKSGELDKDSTTQKIRVVRMEGKRQVTRPIDFYNLDMIISVGYRVNSKNATTFRIWATNVLKDYLVKGYAINENRIKQVEAKYSELKDVVRLIGRTVALQENISQSEQNGLLSVITDYVYALDTLDRYDYQQLLIDKTTANETFHATYENAMEAIRSLKDKFGASTLFGHEKDESFKSSIGQIYQTFDGVELYPSVEEKAAVLLYLVTKNHSFSDGNKRIAATLFLWFMYNNGILYNSDGTKRIADNTLVALTLMIAESRTEEKDTMVKVVVNLINKNND